MYVHIGRVARHNPFCCPATTVSMEEVVLEPDDVLTGAGTIREETEVECPSCGESTVVHTQDNSGVCTSCDSTLELSKPF